MRWEERLENYFKSIEDIDDKEKQQREKLQKEKQSFLVNKVAPAFIEFQEQIEKYGRKIVRSERECRVRIPDDDVDPYCWHLEFEYAITFRLKSNALIPYAKITFRNKKTDQWIPDEAVPIKWDETQPDKHFDTTEISVDDILEHMTFKYTHFMR